MKNFKLAGIKLAAAVTAFATLSLAHAQDLQVVSIQAETGPAAFTGAQNQKGIRLAIEKINAQGGINGKKINLITRDNASDKGQAINLVHQAIERDRALLVLGPSSSPDSLAVAPVFNDLGVPNLSFATADAILKQGPWSLKFQQSPTVTAPLVAQYALEKTPARKIALVFDRTSEAMIDSKNVFRDTFKAGGGTIVAEEAVVGNDTNFLPLVTKLKSMDLDGVYIAALTEQSAGIVVQLRQAGLTKARIFGSLVLASPKYASITGALGEGSIGVADHAIGIDRPMNREFEAAYKAKYGVEADSWAALGYSLALVGMAAIKEAGPEPTREKVRDAFSRIKDVPILGGTGKWNQTNRVPNFGAMVLVMRDGKFIVAP